MRFSALVQCFSSVCVCGGCFVRSAALVQRVYAEAILIVVPSHSTIYVELVRPIYVCAQQKNKKKLRDIRYHSADSVFFLYV